MTLPEDWSRIDEPHDPYDVPGMDDPDIDKPAVEDDPPADTPPPKLFYPHLRRAHASLLPTHVATSLTAGNTKLPGASKDPDVCMCNRA